MCVPYLHSLNTPHWLLVGAQRHSDLGVGGWVRGIVSGKAGKHRRRLPGQLELEPHCLSGASFMRSPRTGSAVLVMLSGDVDPDVRWGVSYDKKAARLGMDEEYYSIEVFEVGMWARLGWWRPQQS